jgi:hypothetical protein
VVTDQSGSGMHTLYQDVVIPANAKSVTLRWSDMIRNHAESFSHPNQEFRVEIRNTSNAVLATVFSTNPGDPMLGGWVNRYIDLSAFIGQTIRIAFTEQDNLLYLNVHLDDISIEINSGISTTWDVYFGTNPSSLVKIAENLGVPSCGPVPPGQVLEYNTTYTWKVIAKNAGGQTEGPVWTFTTEVAGPTVTINQAGDQADPTNVSPINFTVVFSEPVIDFGNNSLTLGGTAGATTVDISGSGPTYNVAVSGMTQSGTVIATIAEGAVHNAAGNPNSASTSSDNIVSFTVTPTPTPTPAPPPVLQGAVSRKTHGSAGMFDINLLLPVAGIECRIGGPTKVVLTFDQAVTKAADFAVTLSSGTVGTTACVGSTLEINLSGATNKTWVTIGVSGLQGAGTLEGTYSVTVGALYGDVDFNKKVNSNDIYAVKAHASPLDVTSSNFKYDLDCSGMCNANDAIIVKSKASPIGLP